jgi:ABC-type lipoprotein export system ATPase subunit
MKKQKDRQTAKEIVRQLRRVARAKKEGMVWLTVAHDYRMKSNLRRAA